MLSSSYYGVWFIVDLLRCDVFHRFIVTLNLYESDSDRQNGFNLSNILNHNYLYVEELKS